MKPRLSFLSRLAAFFRRQKPAPKRRSPVKQAKHRGIEPLEGRIAPASLVNASTVTYTDVGGDLVTIHFSKAIFDPHITSAQLDAVFKFSDSTTFASSGEQDLMLMDLSKVPLISTQKNPADGVSFTIGATPVGNAGDGTVKIGAISAVNLALGNVTVGGDLGQIDAGRASSKVALKSLTVDSMYQYGAATQLSGAVSPMESKILGAVASFTVKQDFHGYLHVQDGNSIVKNAVKTTAPGNVGKIVIFGSIIGGADANSGSISVQETVGGIQILGIGELTPRGLIGGDALNSGSITAAKGIGSVTIADSIVGGAGAGSGAIIAKANLGKLSIANDLLGGTGSKSGTIQAGSLKRADVAGDIRGGDGSGSGSLLVGKVLSKLSLGGDLKGGAGKTSGSIRAATLGNLALHGSIIGGSGEESGVVYAIAAITSLTLDHDIQGGTNTDAGGIGTEGLLKSVVVKGNITGGTAAATGVVGSDGSIHRVNILGNVQGGDADNTGQVFSAGSIDELVVGKLTGGGGYGSGSIVAATDFAFTNSSIKSVTVIEGLHGGDGQNSGSILSGGAIGKVTVGRAMANADVVGGAGAFSGSILSAGQLKNLTLNGSLTSSQIHVGEALLKATITGNVNDSTITALGAANPKLKTGDIAIGSLTVNGSVAGSQILAGYDITGAATNADASIKFVRVKGDWSASDLVAGVQDTNGDGFGDEDNARIVGDTDRDGFIATIAKVQILGGISGDANDHGFVAERINAFQVGGTKLALSASPGDVIKIGTTDVTVREVTS